LCYSLTGNKSHEGSLFNKTVTINQFNTSKPNEQQDQTNYSVLN